MIDSKTTSVIDLIFNKEFRLWLEKGQPFCTNFSNLGETLLEEAIELIFIFESQKQAFSKQVINEKYTKVISRIKSEE